MAHITISQRDAMGTLATHYGEPSRISLEDTDEPYGVVRITWFSDSPIGHRSLYIRPDGSRLNWRTL